MANMENTLKHLKTALVQQEGHGLPVNLFQVTEFNSSQFTLDGKIKILGEPLGQGSFAKVYKCRIPGMLKTAIVKLLARGGVNQDDALINEVVIARQLRHPNICDFFGALQTETGAGLVMELVAGITLFELWKDEPQAMPEAMLRDVTHQTLQALCYLDSAGIVHGDIKNDNIMISPDGTIKLIDFGLAVDMKNPGHIKVRPRQRSHPPETRTLNMGGICPKTDVFMLGALMYKYACVDWPFGFVQDKSDATLESMMAKGLVVNTKQFRDLCADLRHLFVNMMTLDSAHRLSAEQAIKHTFFTGQAEFKYRIPRLMKWKPCSSPTTPQELNGAAIDNLASKLEMERIVVIDTVLTKPNGWLGIAYRANVGNQPEPTRVTIRVTSV
eukprot:scpid86893/ scgid10692/ Serine/threonine-protein kinase DDB_G0283821